MLATGEAGFGEGGTGDEIDARNRLDVRKCR
jgi:hypothetical protein